MDGVIAPEEEPPILPGTLELERESAFDVVFRQIQARPQRGAWHECFRKWRLLNQLFENRDGTPKNVFGK